MNTQTNDIMVLRPYRGHENWNVGRSSQRIPIFQSATHLRLVMPACDEPQPNRENESKQKRKAANVGGQANPKRWKIAWSDQQLLEDAYRQNPFPDAETLSSLSVLLEIKLRKVRVWFQNKRQRDGIDLPLQYAMVAACLSAEDPCMYLNDPKCTGSLIKRTYEWMQGADHERAEAFIRQFRTNHSKKMQLEHPDWDPAYVQSLVEFQFWSRTYQLLHDAAQYQKRTTAIQQ